MSRLPQLEAQLVAAAGARTRTRRRFMPRRALAGLAVAAAAAGLALVVAPRREAPPVPPRPAAPAVPATTLERSHALTTETRASDTAVLTPEQVTDIAAGFEASTPHPPGMGDRYDWAHPKAPIARAAEIQSLVEYRSYCLWLRYWVDGADRTGAAQVLADIPRWPSQRTTDPFESKLLQQKEDAIASGDVAVIQRELDTNCRGI